MFSLQSPRRARWNSRLHCRKQPSSCRRRRRPGSSSRVGRVWLPFRSLREQRSSNIFGLYQTFFFFIFLHPPSPDSYRKLIILRPCGGESSFSSLLVAFALCAEISPRVVPFFQFLIRLFAFLFCWLFRRYTTCFINSPALAMTAIKCALFATDCMRLSKSCITFS